MVNSNPRKAKAKTIAQTKKAKHTHDKLLHDYQERLKELRCLYGFSKLVEKPNTSLEDILQMTSDLLPSAWKYPDITCSRIISGKKEFRTKNFRETILEATILH
jgi:hypothetical protein